MRLIDADALKQEVLRIHEEHFKTSKLQFIHDFFKAIFRRINKAPTIDAELVKHGRWVERLVNIETLTTDLFCSECKFASVNWRYNYCPNCGAKMDEEDEA